MCQLYTIWSTFCIVLTLRNKRASAVMIRQFKESPAVSPSGLRAGASTPQGQKHSHWQCRTVLWPFAAALSPSLPTAWHPATYHFMHVHTRVSICCAPTHTHTHTWKSHAYLHLHISNSAGHVLTRLPGAPYELHTAHMHIDTNTYITFTFRWCFHKQKANNEHKHTHTHARFWTPTRINWHTHKTRGPRVFLLLFPRLSPLRPQVAHLSWHVSVCVCELEGNAEAGSGNKNRTVGSQILLSYFGCFHGTIYVAVKDTSLTSCTLHRWPPFS